MISTDVALLSLIVLVAAIVRGYAGFGFSAIVVAVGSLFLPTREIVPVVLMLEVVASIQMAPAVFRNVQWRLVMTVFLPSLVFVPAGQLTLLWVDAEVMRTVLATLVLLLAALQLLRLRIPVSTGAVGGVTVGIACGYMNGLLAMGGLTVVTMLMHSNIHFAALRASLVALFFITGLFALSTGYASGLVNAQTALYGMLVLPAMVIGIWMGMARFNHSSEALWHRVVCLVLIVIAILLLLKPLL